MPHTGRPPTFDNVKQQVCLRLLAGGYSPREAARHVGVSASTVREKKRTSPAFAAAYDEAKAQAIPSLLETIHSAGQRSWRASAWLLERLRPALFGRRVALGFDPAIPRPTRKRRSHLDEEVINEFFERLAGNRDAQALCRQRLEEVEAHQQAWDAALREYHEHYALRARSLGFGPNESSKPPDDLGLNSSIPESQSHPQAGPDAVAPTDLATGAKNSDAATATENAQLQATQPQPAAGDAANPQLSGARPPGVNSKPCPQ